MLGLGAAMVKYIKRSYLPKDAGTPAIGLAPGSDSRGRWTEKTKTQTAFVFLNQMAPNLVERIFVMQSLSVPNLVTIG